MCTTFCQICGRALYNISASTYVDIEQWPPYSMNNLLSCVITCASQWLFHFDEEIIIAWDHIESVWRMFQYLPSPSLQWKGSYFWHWLGSPSPLVVGDTGTSAILIWYESMHLWSLHQNEWTTVRDTLHHKQTNSVVLSPQANYTDWATATCRLNLVPTFVDRGVSLGQRGGSLMVVNLSFLDRSRYFSFK
jgi:hypothetical protein